MAYVVGGARQKLSMISTVTNQGKTSWMIIDGNFNHLRLIESFEALIKQAGRKVSRDRSAGQKPWHGTARYN